MNGRQVKTVRQKILQNIHEETIQLNSPNEALTFGPRSESF